MPLTNLADIAGIGGGQPGAAPTGGGAPGGSPSQISGNISQLTNNMPASGLKKTANTFVAIATKVLEATLLAYGSGSDEGNSILKAITSLSKLTKGIQTGDMESVVKSLIQSLPAQMRNITPGSANNILSAIQQHAGPGAGAAPAGGGGMPGGAPMPNTGQISSMVPQT